MKKQQDKCLSKLKYKEDNSVIKPATNSDSDSGKSKCTLLISAKPNYKNYNKYKKL